MFAMETDVLIVGAGPTGMALAIALQKAGVKHVIIDLLRNKQNTSRAAVIHAHTLEMLETIGAADTLERAGLSLLRFTVRDRDKPLLEFDFSSLPSPYQHLLMLPQSTTEELLEARLADLGGLVVRGVEALSATASQSDGATVRVKTKRGERDIRARYVVGADGMRSVVRQSAGLAFDGEEFGESFVLADVRMEWPHRDEVSLFFSPAGLVVVAPLPDGSYRIVATLDEAPEHPGIADIQRLLDARGPTRTCRVADIVWSSRFRVHHRLASHYRSGPFVVMGDAAHVHSPAGGQGMNTGLVDAVLLGEALTRVVCDQAPDSVLDDYARIRRQAAQEVLSLASRLTRLATMRSVPGRRIRNLILRVLNRVPPFKRALTLGLSGLGRRKYALLHVGDRGAAPPVQLSALPAAPHDIAA